MAKTKKHKFALWTAGGLAPYPPAAVSYLIADYSKVKTGGAVHHQLT